jgi:hypothetical protein
MTAIANAYFFLNPEGKRPLRRPWGNWRDNINMHITGIG